LDIDFFDPVSKICTITYRRGDKASYPLSRLREFADKELEEMEKATPPEGPSPGYSLGYELSSIKGWYYRKMAKHVFLFEVPFSG